MQAASIPLLVILAHFPFVLGKPEFRAANGMFANRNFYSTIEVSNGGPWGSWTWVDMCPEGSYAIGYSLKVEETFSANDETSLNGIRLFCTNRTSSAFTIESNIGEFGYWARISWCPTGFLSSFQLKVESPQGILDDTAVNNIRFRCSTGVVLENPGGPYGEYASWSDACPRGGICGLQTKQEPYRGLLWDDTALNDVRFFCCE
uniref:Vitelline membrane outer layer 1 homolog n=1 Tax=Ornithorhynchus anatinus TaxID=9258 RepID=F7CRS6_ORNAN